MIIQKSYLRPSTFEAQQARSNCVSCNRYGNKLLLNFEDRPRVHRYGSGDKLHLNPADVREVYKRESDKFYKALKMRRNQYKNRFCCWSRRASGCKPDFSRLIWSSDQRCDNRSAFSCVQPGFLNLQFRLGLNVIRIGRGQSTGQTATHWALREASTFSTLSWNDIVELIRYRCLRVFASVWYHLPVQRIPAWCLGPVPFLPPS